MTQTPKHPKAIVPELVSNYKDCYGDALVSVIIYGSAASGDYVPGASDINLMVVLSDDGIDALEKALDLVSKWRKRGVGTPLFLSEAYVHNSLDVFPIEYLNFQNSYDVVYGKDILADLQFDPKHLRLQCEREIKGKLLLLREGFLEADGKDKHVRALLSDSLHALVAIFNGLLFLKDRDRGGGSRVVIQQLCQTMGLEAGPFEGVLDIKQKRSKPSGAALENLFKSYIKEIGKLVRIVNQL